MRKITNEQIIVNSKRIMSEIEFVEDDVNWLANDMRYMPEEHLDMHARDLAHKLLAISKIKIEKAWENGR